jgi:NADH-quinone oxidoreductase subunit N
MATLISLIILGILILVEGLLKKKSWLLPTILAGLLTAFLLTILPWGTNHHFYNDMLIIDNSAIAFSAVMIATTFLIFLFAGHYYRAVSRPLDDIYAILIFALVGAVMMVSYGNLIILFLGIETMSIALYILAGSHKESIGSNEATLKYFLLGTFMSGFLLFGIALIYGSTGSYNLQAIAEFVSRDPAHLSGIFKAGLCLMIIGMAFKIAIVPFHFWAPDVYEGTPTLVTAFMATVVKIASIIALYRVFSICFSSINSIWETLLWILAALTIILGNLTGLYQPGLKRMLAYSSISHSGYMMLAILAFSAHTADALLLYAISYSLATVLAFGILILVRGATGNDSFTSFNGMARKNPMEAFCLTVAMFSLAGIPPLAGFMAKYYLFTTALEQRLVWLVLIALLGSMISVAYYFKPVMAMYFKEGEAMKMESGLAFRINIVVLTALILLAGMLPFLVITLL